MQGHGVSRRGLIGTALLGAGVLFTAVAKAAGSDHAFDLTDLLTEQLARYASFGEKESGMPGELAAADWIAASLKSAGYDVETDRFTVPRFSATRTGRYVGGRQMAIKPQPVVSPTSPEGISARACIIRKPRRL